MIVSVKRTDGKVLGANLERMEDFRFIPAEGPDREGGMTHARLTLYFASRQVEYEGDEAERIFDVIQRDAYAA